MSYRLSVYLNIHVTPWSQHGVRTHNGHDYGIIRPHCLPDSGSQVPDFVSPVKGHLSVCTRGPLLAAPRLPLGRLGLPCSPVYPASCPSSCQAPSLPRSPQERNHLTHLRPAPPGPAPGHCPAFFPALPSRPLRTPRGPRTQTQPQLLETPRPEGSHGSPFHTGEPTFRCPMPS